LDRIVLEGRDLDASQVLFVAQDSRRATRANTNCIWDAAAAVANSARAAENRATAFAVANGGKSPGTGRILSQRFFSSTFAAVPRYTVTRKAAPMPDYPYYLSIVPLLPTANPEPAPRLERALASIAFQHRLPHEVIVVDVGAPITHDRLLAAGPASLGDRLKIILAEKREGFVGFRAVKQSSRRHAQRDVA